MWLTCVRGQTHFASLIHRLYSASCHVAPNNPRVHFRGGAEGKITAIFPFKKYVESCFCVFFPHSSLIPFVMDLFMLARFFFPLISCKNPKFTIGEKQQIPFSQLLLQLACHCFLCVFSAAQHLDLVSLSHQNVHNQSQVFSLQTKIGMNE